MFGPEGGCSGVWEGDFSLPCLPLFLSAALCAELLALLPALFIGFLFIGCCGIGCSAGFPGVFIYLLAVGNFVVEYIHILWYRLHFGFPGVFIYLLAAGSIVAFFSYVAAWFSGIYILAAGYAIYWSALLRLEVGGLHNRIL